MTVSRGVLALTPNCRLVASARGCAGDCHRAHLCLPCTAMIVAPLIFTGVTTIFQLCLTAIDMQLLVYSVREWSRRRGMMQTGMASRGRQRDPKKSCFTLRVSQARVPSCLPWVQVHTIALDHWRCFVGT